MLQYKFNWESTSNPNVFISPMLLQKSTIAYNDVRFKLRAMTSNISLKYFCSLFFKNISIYTGPLDSSFWIFYNLMMNSK